VLLNAIQTACKLITRSVRKAGIAGLYGSAGSENATGDEQKKIDVLSNEMMVNALTYSNSCCILVSEENDDPIFIPEQFAGKFCVAFDPLDGSSNIDCNVATGTIFSIWEKKSEGLTGQLSDILRPGNEIVCAGYCAYGSATELVLTYYGGSVQRFTLDPSIGEFILTGADLKLPEVCKTIYSINDGNYTTWDKNMQKAIDGFKFREKPYTSRYVGSMVADIHRTLLYGGIYLYPADAAKGNGKLRVLYECFPMATIVERAGGAASTGLFKNKISRLLDLVPASIHEKCPIVIGCHRDVNMVLSHYKYV